MATIHLIRTSATPELIRDMLQAFDEFIKLAVDIEQENIWGADWLPEDKEVRFESFINIRPNQNNPSMMILDVELRNRVEQVARKLLERA